MKISLSIICMFIGIAITSAQCPINNTTSTTPVNCYGGNDGTATANPTGGNAPYTFLWMPSGDTTATVTGLSAGVTYTLTIRDSTPCTPLVQTFTVSQPPNPAGAVTGNATVCQGVNSGTVTLSGFTGVVLNWLKSTNGGISWTSIANTTTSQNYNNINSTTKYAAIVQNGTCAGDTSSAATITVIPNLASGTISGSATVCSGANNGTLTLSGNADTVLGWESSTDGGNTWMVIANALNSQLYHNLIITTKYRVLVENGTCPAIHSAIATVTVNPASVGGNTVGSTQVCSGSNAGSISLNSYIGRVTEWAFSTNNGVSFTNIIDTTASLTYSNLTTTTTYIAIVKSGVCAADTSIASVVTVNPTPIDSFTIAPVCLGQTSMFYDSSTVNSGTLQFTLWNFGDSTSSVSTNPIHLYANAGSYPVTLKVISDKGCASINTHNAVVNALPNPLITPSGALSFCFGGSVTLSGENGLNYLWSTGATTQSIIDSVSRTVHLMVSNSSTGCVNSDSIKVVVFPLPLVHAGNDTTISLGFSYTLNGQQGAIYSWLPTTGLSNANIYNPIAEPLVTTNYVLTVTDSNQCVNTDSLVITVLDDYLFTVSNALTPNGDGLNDVWNVQNLENYPDNSIAIFNRYGQEVYSATPYKNDWGGTYGGQLLPDGTYYYVLTFKGSPKIFKGGVTIVDGSK